MILAFGDSVLFYGNLARGQTRYRKLELGNDFGARQGALSVGRRERHRSLDSVSPSASANRCPRHDAMSCFGWLWTWLYSSIEPGAIDEIGWKEM